MKTAYALICALLFCSSLYADTSLCGSVTLKQGRLELDRNQKILVCGSDRSDGWRDVPVPQAEYQLKIILQNKGYLNARFERDGDRLFVWTGEPTTTQILTVEGPRGLMNPDKKRKVVGYPMEPVKLDEVSSWAYLKLRRQGYACPDVNMSAQAWDGTMTAQLEPGDHQTIRKVKRNGYAGLDQEAIGRRLEAFKPGEPYDVIDTQITVSRILSQGLFQSAYFTTHCEGDQVDLHLFADVGKSRILRFGLGASTEELPFADLWYKDTRLDPMASSYTLVLHASPIRQSLDATSELYIIPGSTRSYLGPRFTAERLREQAYTLQKIELGTDIGRAWDKFKLRFQGTTGPTLNYEKTTRGIGPAELKYLSWQGTLGVMSHAYEAFSRDQYEGWNSTIKYVGQREGIGSKINVDRYDFDFKHLWNVGGYSPPLFIFATRVEAIAVNTKQLESDSNALPVGYRIFFGGDENMRGFSRQSLNNAGLGYLTALHAGFEVRLIEEIPYHLQPFLLFDAARLGSRRYTVDRPVYTASGIGLRWPSPFGTLRGSAARGRIYKSDEASDNYQQEWVYFLSFGQEF